MIIIITKIKITILKTDFKGCNINHKFNHIYKLLENKLPCKLHTSKKHELSEDDQELRPKHVGAVINKYKHCAAGLY
jgi:hypothetical protein